MFVGRIILFFTATSLAGESNRLAAYVLLYRFYYQFLWYFVFDFALFVALKGSYVAWKKMDHSGSVQVEELFEPVVNYSEVERV
jgi:hypothetical protein